MQVYQVSIGKAATWLTVAVLGFYANPMTYWFSIMLANLNTLLSAIISESWPAFLKNTPKLLLAKGMVLKKLWPSYFAQVQCQAHVGDS